MGRHGHDDRISIAYVVHVDRGDVLRRQVPDPCGRTIMVRILLHTSRLGLCRRVPTCSRLGRILELLHHGSRLLHLPARRILLRQATPARGREETEVPLLRRMVLLQHHRRRSHLALHWRLQTLHHHRRLRPAHVRRHHLRLPCQHNSIL